MNERPRLPIDAIAAETIEATVSRWLLLYPLREGNLAVSNQDAEARLKEWATGVWGRIKHQLDESGWPYDNTAVLALAAKYLHEELADDPLYEKLLPHLPSAGK